MKHIILAALLVLVAKLNGEAGTIVGTVQARSKSGPDGAAGGKYDSRKFKFAELVDYESLRDFVVCIEGPVGTNAVQPSTPARIVTKKTVSQKGAAFTPRILPVMVGATIEWPNEDEIFHNVFSISEAKEFDLGLYKKPEVKQVTFDKTGRVDVFCSIHSSMNCVVLVVENQFFATTDDKGHYTITGVPPGTYQLKAWHERLPSQRQTVTVGETGEVRMNFVLGPGGPAKN